MPRPGYSRVERSHHADPGYQGTVGSDAEGVFRKADKELKDLRDQEQQVRRDATMSRAAREQLIKDIRENMRQVQDEARKANQEIKRREPTF